MEKAVLKTIKYSEIFEYPLKGYEIHKWLIGLKASLLQVEKALNKLLKKSKIKYKKEYYFSSGKEKLVSIRERKEEQSEDYLNKAIFISQLLKIIPWIKLIGVSGGLSMMNASKKDDIDFFVITSKRRLWLSRFLILGLLTIINQRRKANDKKRNTAGKICINTILDEENLEQKFKDIYTAHEVLQMKLLWQRDGIYSKFLKDNNWVFKFLPNWTSKIKYRKSVAKKGIFVFDFLEYIARGFQLRIMEKPKGMERVEEGGLYFHPQDYRRNVLKEFSKKFK